MNSRILGFAMIAGLLMAVCGCDDDSNPAGTGGSGSSLTIDQFPMEVGQSWTYEVQTIEPDGHESVDTLEIRVVDLTDESETSKTLLWQRAIGSRFSVTDVYVKGDSVRFFGSIFDISSYPLLVFPMEAGDAWGITNFPVRDTCKVFGVSLVIVPAGTFFSTRVEISPVTVMPDQGSYSQIWIAPDVGIVQIEQTSISIAGATNRVWKLLSHEFKQVKQIDLADFPMAVGNQWNYRSYDSVTDESGSVDINITMQYRGLKSIDSAFNWRYNLGDTTYNQFVTLYDNIVSFNSIGEVGPFFGHALSFPIKWNRYVDFPPPFDIDIVEGVQTIEVPVGRFESAWRTVYKQMCGDECAHTVINWYVAGIGLVQRQELIFELSLVDYTKQVQQDIEVTFLKNTVWQLDSYSVE